MGTFQKILLSSAVQWNSQTLGQELFFDPMLSGNNETSCATCHSPNKGWSDGLPTAVGFEGKILTRRTPPVDYLHENSRFFWDGRARSLEEQALGPITSPDEMNQDLSVLVTELQSSNKYNAAFGEVFGTPHITSEKIAKVLADFERGLATYHSPYDRWQAGDNKAMSASAIRGHSLFHTWETSCLNCHAGNHFTNGGFFDIGVSGGDKGIGSFYPEQPRLQHAFKTPGLRNVAKRAPYMHNGSLATLEDVIRFYARGGDHQRESLAPPIRGFEISEQEVEDLVAFLEALSDENP